MSQDSGVIYILTNPSFPNYQKIGKTTDLKQRLNSLNDKSCLPFSFRVHATYKVDGVKNLEMVEQQIHRLIDMVDDTLRAREETEKGKLREREFFAIDKENAYSILESVAKLRGDLHNLELKTLTKQERAEEKIAEVVEQEVKKTQKRGRKPFTWYGIPVGAELEFADNPTIKVKVADETNKVEYNGKVCSMSEMATQLLKAKWQVQGTAHFKYNGKLLTDIRSEIEE
jgi:hypothetical protein